MISADVKTDVKQQEIKELIAVSCKFLYKYTLSELEICIFHLIFLGILSRLILSDVR